LTYRNIPFALRAISQACSKIFERRIIAIFNISII